MPRDIFHSYQYEDFNNLPYCASSRVFQHLRNMRQNDIQLNQNESLKMAGFIKTNQLCSVSSGVMSYMVYFAHKLERKHVQ